MFGRKIIEKYITSTSINWNKKMERAQDENILISTIQYTEIIGSQVTVLLMHTRKEWFC